MEAAGGRLRVGIGGWNYAPWRGPFYPPGLRQADELSHAAARVGAIEINATAYRLQRRETFEKWGAAVPDDFVFTLKASYFCTNRKVLADAGPGIERFFTQGMAALGPKLGPILWQMAPTKTFDPAEMEAFLALLPREIEGTALRHAIEVRHESFDDPRFFDLARARGVAIVIADSPLYPRLDVATADFKYARLLTAREEEPAGYALEELRQWADRARGWARQNDAFMFFINGAKVRAPAAAEALIVELAD